MPFISKDWFTCSETIDIIISSIFCYLTKRSLYSENCPWTRYWFFNIFLHCKWSLYNITYEICCLHARMRCNGFRVQSFQLRYLHSHFTFNNDYKSPSTGGHGFNDILFPQIKIQQRSHSKHLIKTSNYQRCILFPLLVSVS